MGPTQNQESKTILERYRRPLEYACVVSVLPIAGSALIYATRLYSAGDTGFSLQVGGLGLMLLFIILAQFINPVPLESQDGGGGTKREPQPSRTTFAALFGSLLFAAVGFVMLIAGHYV